MGNYSKVSQSFAFSFDADAVTQNLEAWLEEKTGQDARREAAQAMAQIVHDEARAGVDDSLKPHWFYGTSFRKTGQRYLFQPGTLRNAIYQV